MENEFIPYELALELKELGFNSPCFGYYRCEDRELFPYTYYTGQFNDLILAPITQQAFKFFREKYNIHSYIEIEKGDNTYFYTIDLNELPKNKDKVVDGGFWEGGADDWNHEQAEIECIKELIKIVKDLDSK